MKKIRTLMLVASLAASPVVMATPATDALLAEYKAAGVTKVDAAKAKADWTKEGKDEKGDMVSCSSCHGTDLKKEGKHRKTHKVIEPMAPSVNDKRLTDEKKINKWFKRNCDDAWGRECTAQEKADFLTFLLAQ